MKVLLDTQAAADFLGLKKRTLELLRQQGGGPPFIRLGARTIRYFQDELISWCESKRRVSTSDASDAS